MVGENANFSEISLKPEQLRQIMASPEGQALIRLLQRDGGAGLQAAAKAIQTGDPGAARQALAPLLAGTEGEALAERLQKKL